MSISKKKRENRRKQEFEKEGLKKIKKGIDKHFKLY